MARNRKTDFRQWGAIFYRALNSHEWRDPLDIQSRLTMPREEWMPELIARVHDGSVKIRLVAMTDNVFVPQFRLPRVGNR